MRNRAALGAGGAATSLGAFAAMFAGCCVTPWLAGLLGVGAVATLENMAFLRPVAIVGALGFAALAVWLTLRARKRCQNGDACPVRS